jgi:hypothetical protein
MSDRWEFLRDFLWPFARDVLLFVVGLVGAIHEIATVGVERPTLLALLAAMMGLPLFLRADDRGEKRK